MQVNGKYFAVQTTGRSELHLGAACLHRVVKALTLRVTIDRGQRSLLGAGCHQQIQPVTGCEIEQDGFLLALSTQTTCGQQPPACLERKGL